MSELDGLLDFGEDDPTWMAPPTGPSTPPGIPVVPATKMNDTDMLRPSLPSTKRPPPRSTANNDWVPRNDNGIPPGPPATKEESSRRRIRMVSEPRIPVPISQSGIAVTPPAYGAPLPPAAKIPEPSSISTDFGARGGFATQMRLVNRARNEITSLPSTHFNTHVNDDDELPEKLQVVLPRTGSIAKGIKAGVPSDHRRRPAIEMRPERADAESANVQGASTKHYMSHDTKSSADALDREDAGRRARRMRRFSAQHGRGDIPLVMPLDAQLAALDKAVRTAVEAAEDMGRHRRLDPWYDTRDERVIPPTSPLPPSPRLLSDMTAPLSSVATTKRSAEQENESAILPRASVAELRAAAFIEGLDSDLASADVAAAEDAARWQSLEDELRAAENDIRKEMAFFQTVRAALDGSSGADASRNTRRSVRRRVEDDESSGETLRRRAMRQRREETADGASRVQRFSSPVPPPIPPASPYTPGVPPPLPKPTSPRLRRRVVSEVDSPLPPGLKTRRSSPTVSDTKTHDVLRRRPRAAPRRRRLPFVADATVAKIAMDRSPQLAELERKLSIAVAKEDFAACRQIQAQIDEISARRDQTIEEIRDYRVKSRDLDRRVVAAVDAEDFGSAQVFKSKLESLDDRYFFSADDPARVSVGDRSTVDLDNDGRPDKQALLERLTAQMETAIKWEDYEKCAELQAVLGPLREEVEREARKRSGVRMEVAELKRKLREAVELEDFRACAMLQSRIDAIMGPRESRGRISPV